MKFVVKRDNEEVAQVLVIKRGRGWSLTDLYVEPMHRGQGYGGRVLRKALSWADREGVRIALRVYPYGKGALMPSWELTKFYQRYGFIVNGNRMIRLPKKDNNEKGNEDTEVYRSGSGFAIHPPAIATRKSKGSQGVAGAGDGPGGAYPAEYAPRSGVIWS